MAMAKLLLAFGLGAAFLGQAAATDYDYFGIPSHECGPTIERDVCVIGGGTSGAHAAVKLKDAGKTVIVVNHNEILGGQTYTYIDEKTKKTADVGTTYYDNTDVVKALFGKFEISLSNVKDFVVNQVGQPSNPNAPAWLYQTCPNDVDFRYGTTIAGIPPSEPGQAEAFQRLAIELAKYPFLLGGFDLPEPCPEDLLLPFHIFVEKYQLQSIVRIIFAHTEGMGNILEQLTIYVLKAFGLRELKGLAEGFLTTTKGYNGELYVKIAAYLGIENVLHNTNVIKTKRCATSGRAEILVSSPHDGNKILSCGKILLTNTPMPSKMLGWDWTAEELAILNKFDKRNGYFSGLVTNVKLDTTKSYFNNAPGTPYSLPVLPGMYKFSPAGGFEDTWYTHLGSLAPMKKKAAQAIIIAEIQALQKSQGCEVTEPEFVVFKSRGIHGLSASADSIRGGFYKQLNALQGCNNMYYSGAAFSAQSSHARWEYTEKVVVPKMLA